MIKDYKMRIPQIISEIPIKNVPEGWALLFDPIKCETLAMNEMGLLIYNSIDGNRSIGEIIDIISQKCEKSPSIIVKDVLEFVDSLVQEKIAKWK